MKSKLFLFIFLLLIFVGLVGGAQVFAQNEEVSGKEDAALIGLGTVARVEAGQLVLLEYNFETDAEQEIVYQVDANTQYENIRALSDLKAGDSAEVVYIDEVGRKVAVSVSKEENYIEDDDALPPDVGAESAQPGVSVNGVSVPGK